jgi:hypothetical protein
MVRARDSGCITCEGQHEQMDCGHFRQRESMSTRFHPYNVNAQGVKENRFEGGRIFEYGLAIDRKHRAGTAQFGQSNPGRQKNSSNSGFRRGWGTRCT